MSIHENQQLGAVKQHFDNGHKRVLVGTRLRTCQWTQVRISAQTLGINT